VYGVIFVVVVSYSSLGETTYFGTRIIINIKIAGVSKRKLYTIIIGCYLSRIQDVPEKTFEVLM